MPTQRIYTLTLHAVLYTGPNPLDPEIIELLSTDAGAGAEAAPRQEGLYIEAEGWKGSG
jgi:hypothetical protein